MDDQPTKGAEPSREHVPVPQTSHAGIIEHFKRVIEFFNTADAIQAQHPESAFRLRMAAIYSCQAIAELMLEQAFQGELTIGRDDLKAVLTKAIPYFNLVERIRIHDFHRYGLTPPVQGWNVMMGYGPTTLTARKGAAILQQTPDGPKIKCTGNSSVKERRPLYSVDGTFYDEEKKAQVPLREIVKDYILRVAAAVDEYEKLLKTPGGLSPSFFGDLA